MIGMIQLILQEWSWKDYIQLVNTAAFSFFGLVILFRIGPGGSAAGFLLGFAFLGFGIFRARFYMNWFKQNGMKEPKGPSSE